MEEELRRLALLFLVVTVVTGLPKERHHAVQKEEKAKSRSYIDIDASDPFKVPKSSHYVNKPMPDFDQVNKVEATKEEDAEGFRKPHGREREMEREESNEDEGKSLMVAAHRGGGGGEKEPDMESKGEAMARDGTGGRERYSEKDAGDSFGDKFTDKPSDLQEEHANMMPVQNEDQAPTGGQEEAPTAPKETEMPDNAKALEQESEGKSTVQSIDADSLGSEESYKKANTDNVPEEDASSLEKSMMNQM